MPRVLGIPLEPVLGVRLTCQEPSKLGMTHASPDACKMVVHHDHMLDCIHRALLDELSPRVPVTRVADRIMGRPFPTSSDRRARSSSNAS